MQPRASLLCRRNSIQGIKLLVRRGTLTPHRPRACEQPPRVEALCIDAVLQCARVTHPPPPCEDLAHSPMHTPSGKRAMTIKVSPLRRLPHQLNGELGASRVRRGDQLSHALIDAMSVSDMRDPPAIRSNELLPAADRICNPTARCLSRSQPSLLFRLPREPQQGRSCARLSVLQLQPTHPAKR